MALLAGYDLAARVLEGAGGYRPPQRFGLALHGHVRKFRGGGGCRCAPWRFAPSSFADALGIAGTFTGGIWAFLADGAMTKRFHPAKPPRMACRRRCWLRPV